MFLLLVIMCVMAERPSILSFTYSSIVIVWTPLNHCTSEMGRERKSQQIAKYEEFRCSLHGPVSCSYVV